MAATLSLYLSIEQTHLPFLKPTKTHHFSLLKPSQNPFFFSPKTPPFSLPSSSQSSATSSPQTLQDPFQTNRFLSAQELKSLEKLEDFRYETELASGLLWARVMKPEETDVAVALLAESFAESMMFSGLAGYVTLLGILVKQYLVERRNLIPHTATLLGFYRENNGDENSMLCGTVEVYFNRMGASASPPTPTPPKDSPYICNMSVKKTLRRRGIGWHLLKASEQLISQMSSSREVYLHCRMIDTAPLNMYAKAGYSIVKTDSILVFLMLERRKHLMRKELPFSETPSSDIVDIGEKSSQVNII